MRCSVICFRVHNFNANSGKIKWEFMDVYVARQPIFNKNKKIYGYELLFRDGMSNAFPDIDGDTASSKLFYSSFFGIGIDNITGGKRAFINFTRKLLVKKIPAMFPKEKIMVEILEDVEADEEVVSACQELVRKGYKIALDDFVYKSDLQPLIALAKIIKIDFILTPIEEVKELMNRLADYRVKFLAEKVETHDVFKQALEMGFEYFQGYFFSRPQIMKARDISPSKINLLRIMAEINKEDFRFEDVGKLITMDISISYKLLRYINSAYFRRLRDISSIKQAIILLGEKEIRRFISLIVMADLASDKPDELVRASIIRARFCESLGTYGGRIDNSKLFTLGLFSQIDAILDNTMENIMKNLPLSESIKNALIGGKGDLADYMKLVSCYERGDWNEISEISAMIGAKEEKIPEYYINAVSCADSYSMI